jgi:hypothetical protein
MNLQREFGDKVVVTDLDVKHKKGEPWTVGGGAEAHAEERGRSRDQSPGQIRDESTPRNTTQVKEKMKDEVSTERPRTATPLAKYGTECLPRSSAASTLSLRSIYSISAPPSVSVTPMHTPNRIVTPPPSYSVKKGSI